MNREYSWWWLWRLLKLTMVNTEKSLAKEIGGGVAVKLKTF
jgi:hypothetical protein